MTLTLGAAHVCSVPTVFTIARPVGLSVHLAGIPGYVPRDVGSPSEYHRLGRINLGNSLGYQLHQELATSPQLIYPIAPEFTLLSVNMVAGVVVTIDEIASSTTLMPAASPWDRAATSFVGQSVQAPFGGQSGTLWTYTVPAGRMLFVAGMQIWINRLSTATIVGQTVVGISKSSAPILSLLSQANVVGQLEHAELGSGGMVLLPGETLAATFSDSDTGGQRWVNAIASGFTFAA